jgi:hypothetical protein
MAFRWSPSALSSEFRSPDGDGAQSVDPFGLAEARDQRSAEQNAELVLQRLLRLKKDTETESA